MYTHSQLPGPLAFLLVSQCFLHRPGLICGHLSSLSVPSTLWENTYGVLGMSLHTSGFCKKFTVIWQCRHWRVPSFCCWPWPVTYWGLSPILFPCAIYSSPQFYSLYLLSAKIPPRGHSTPCVCLPHSNAALILKSVLQLFPKEKIMQVKWAFSSCRSTFPLLSSLSFLYLSLPSSPLSSPWPYCFDCIFCLCIFRRTTAEVWISQQWHHRHFRPIKCLAASPPAALCSVPPHPTGWRLGQNDPRYFQMIFRSWETLSMWKKPSSTCMSMVFHMRCCLPMQLDIYTDWIPSAMGNGHKFMKFSSILLRWLNRHRRECAWTVMSLYIFSYEEIKKELTVD